MLVGVADLADHQRRVVHGDIDVTPRLLVAGLQVGEHLNEFRSKGVEEPFRSVGDGLVDVVLDRELRRLDGEIVRVDDRLYRHVQARARVDRDVCDRETDHVGDGDGARQGVASMLELSLVGDGQVQVARASLAVDRRHEGRDFGDEGSHPLKSSPRVGKEGDVPWSGGISGRARGVVDAGEPSCDGQ